MLAKKLEQKLELPAIYVRDRYLDGDVDQLRDQLRSFLHTEPTKGRASFLGQQGREKFESNFILPLLGRNDRRIWIATNSPKRWEVPESTDNGQWLYRFVRGVTVPGTERLQMLDAFLQLSAESATKRLHAPMSFRILGQALGQYLADPTPDQEYDRERVRQKLVRFYQYWNVDNIGGTNATRRYLCLRKGAANGYLEAVDFGFDTEKDLKESEISRVFSGFCIPGEQFSPVVMRSKGFHERVTGLLYAPSSLIDISSPSLNRLRFDIFTSDRSFFAPMDGGARESVIAKVRQSIHGPKVSRSLENVTDPAKTEILTALVKNENLE